MTTHQNHATGELGYFLTEDSYLELTRSLHLLRAVYTMLDGMQNSLHAINTEYFADLLTYPVDSLAQVLDQLDSGDF